MLSPFRAFLGVTLAVVSSAVAVAPVDAPAHADLGPPISFILRESGPLGAVTVIGDSVLMGAGMYSPTLPDRLLENGWGPVRFQAGGGYSTGYFAGVDDSYKATTHFQYWRARQAWDTPNVIVNLGANDSGFCNSSVQCARNAILHLVDAIGPGHRIWWPQITRFYTHADQQHAWNTALQQIAAEREDFYTWDWPAAMVEHGIQSSDNTHLSASGYRLRSQLMADDFTNQLARATRVGDDAPLPTAIGSAVEYVPLGPARVLDTRQSAALAAGGEVTVDLTGHVPDGATAAAIGLTATGAGADGYLTAYPCDRARGEVSSVNYGAGVDRGAMAVLPLSADDTLCVYSSAPTHVLVDIQGAFVPGDADSTRFTPLATPERLADTRATQRVETLQVQAPLGAAAVALNLTADGADSWGYLTAYPCGGAVPEVSSVNFGPGEPVAGSVYVPTGDDGQVCVLASTSVDVIVDITGTFTAGTGLRFVPAEPTRVIDTRNAIGGWAPVQGEGQTIDARVAPPAATAVTGTLTLVGPVGDGYLTAYGCGTAPETSSVNARRGADLANSLTVGVSDDGDLCVTSSAVANTLFDTTGWWVP